MSRPLSCVSRRKLRTGPAPHRTGRPRHRCQGRCASHRQDERQALADAKVTLDEIDAIAVTQGPGLAGALLVGITYAKTLAYAADKPIIAVNHLEGHIHAVLMEERQRGNRDVSFPLLALVVS